MKTRIVVVLAGLALAAPALGQNALGDGRALDRSLMRGSGGRNFSRPDLAREVQFRNAIVTGNAPGGLSFREDVGYTSPSGFRDELGSDDLFAFRRDSLYSGLAGMGIRGTDALQYQFALTTGAAAPLGLRGTLQVERGFDRPAAGAPDTLFSQREEDDERGFALYSLRSPASIITSRGMMPAIISTDFKQGDEELALTASPLRGLHLDPVTSLRASGGRPDLSAPAAGPDTRAAAARPDDAKDPYAEVRARLADKAAQTPNVPDWQARLDEVREQVRGEELEREIAPETAEVLRSSGTIERFAPASPPQTGPRDFDPYAEHMRAGQEHLSRGRFFDAEERFTRALASRPGDILAGVARAHAQAGAGMFLSASVNLRGLFESAPELIGVRYGSESLPSPERVARLIESLRAGLSRSNPLPPEAGLALAYLGFQSDDLGALLDGLAALDRSETARGLVPLLREVWIPDAPDSPNPVEAPDGGG